jgi:hypothetical protein
MAELDESSAPILVTEGPSQRWAIFEDGANPDQFAEAWYDAGETGLVENPILRAAVTLIVQGPYNRNEAEQLIASEQEKDDHKRDELRDSAILQSEDRRGAVVRLTRQFTFDPVHHRLLGERLDLEEMKKLVGELFRSLGMESPR